jgi:peptide chain release factor 1
VATPQGERFGQVPGLLTEYAQLEKDLADPSIHADQGKARQLGKRYAALGPVIGGYRAFKSAEDDLAAGREMAAEDPSFTAEIPALEAALAAAEENLEELLLPRDPNEDRDVILEIKAGVGGDESALFAGDFSACINDMQRSTTGRQRLLMLPILKWVATKKLVWLLNLKGLPNPVKHLMQN